MKSFVAAALAAGALAVPTPQAATPPAGITDAVILNYALTLEHLEDTFYKEALANYTEADFAAQGFDSTFYQNLMTVSSDESTHVAVLTQTLQAAGQPATAACTYSFPATDPKSFVALASILEGVGVSAYLGAAADIVSATYLVDAGSILTVESRHSAYIRNALSESPFPSPFDVPLDFDEVYSLASQFIASCPSSNPTLPVKAFPVLTLDPTTPMPVAQNQTVNFMAANAITGCDVYAAFVTVTGPVFTTVTSADNGAGKEFSIAIPAGLVEGQSYVVLTSSNSGVTDDNILAGPAIVEVEGPAGV